MNVVMEIQNLKCSGCASTIKNKISTIENISNVEVAVEANTVFFEYVSEFDLQKVTETLLKIGYPSVDNTNSTTTKVKSYISCAIGKIQK